ncbi:hypothetical protein HETIRDRAFT_319127, partial [Heterobasidion irregulare TC 32-1]
FGRCSAQSRNRSGAIISHSPIASHSSTPALEVVLVLCSALRATSSVTFWSPPRGVSIQNYLKESTSLVPTNSGARRTTNSYR